MAVNRYQGEIRINPVPILRNDDFNNDGEIVDIDLIFSETLRINREISERIERLKKYLDSEKISGSIKFHFAEGGTIAVRGLPDNQLIDMNSKGLIDLFDFAVDKEWVKKYGRLFNLVWENGRAVKI